MEELKSMKSAYLTRVRCFFKDSPFVSSSSTFRRFEGPGVLEALVTMDDG
jgi:hypothetical protein